MDGIRNIELGRQDSTIVRGATEFVVTLLEASVRSRVHLRGRTDLPPGPLLFASNHFTRMETFLLPWLLERTTGRRVSSLAWHGLFRGAFGDYLQSVGARSTREQGIKRRIVDELASGKADWLIYPEGEMVKNKRVWDRGRLHLSTEEQLGPHHTGAAMFALKATQERLRAGLTDPVFVVPLNVTYHPVRPRPNAILRIARRLFGSFPEHVEEELLVEGSLLLSHTDIDVVLGEPIDLRDWIPRARAPHETTRALLRHVTTRLMQEVYRLTVRNIDHLACTAVAHLGRAPVSEEDLARALLLASRETETTSGGFWHHSVGPALLDALSGVRSEAFDDILRLAASEGHCRRSGGRLERVETSGVHRYDHVRLRDVTGVLANEIAPDRVLVRAIAHWIGRAPSSLRSKAAALLERTDLEAHAREGGVPEQAPRWIEPPSPRGVVVLAHGYLASPAETTPLALHLASRGWACYLVRLAGHASNPDHLLATHRADWWRSFQRGLAIARCRHPDKPLVVAGFSAGSILALQAAAELLHPPRGLVVVNAPILLSNRASLLAPLLDGWNHAMHSVGIDTLAHDAVRNDSEYPDDNYCRNPVRSMHQMELATSEVRALLGRIRAPTLIVQGDRDPVVQPRSAEILLREIASPSRSLVWWPATRHGIIRGEGCAALHERIANWMEHL